MLRLIAGSKLKDFHIVQNENTPKAVTPCTAKAWMLFKQSAPKELRVHLVGIFAQQNGSDLLIQPEAPVYAIKCKNVSPLQSDQKNLKLNN